MKENYIKSIFTKVFIFFLLFICLTLNFNFPVYAKLPEDSTLNSYLEKSFSQLKVPGGAAIFIDGDDVRIYLYGENQSGLINENSQFLLGSFSESMTALGILKLIDEGKISENTKLIEILPEFVDRNPYTTGITIKELLSHTSGISKAYGYKFSSLNHTGKNSIGEVLKNVSRLPIGKKEFDDSNLNYILLGSIIEKASGKSFGEYLKDEIFTPLEMKSTFPYKDEAAQNGMTKGFRSALGITYSSMLFYDDAGAPYGYITTTPNDLEKYIRYLMNPQGEPLLKKSTKDLIKNPLYSKDFRNNYGYGFNMINPGTDEAELVSNGFIGDYNSQILIMPSKNQALALLVNKGHALEAPSMEELRDNLKRVFEGKYPQPINSPIPWIPYSIALLASIVVISFFIRLATRKKIKEHALVDYVSAALQILLGLGLFPLIDLILGYPFRIMGFLAPDVTIALFIIVMFLVLHGLFTFYKIFFIDRNKTLFPKIPYKRKKNKKQKKSNKALPPPKLEETNEYSSNDSSNDSTNESLGTKMEIDVEAEKEALNDTSSIDILYWEDKNLHNNPIEELVTSDDSIEKNETTYSTPIMDENEVIGEEVEEEIVEDDSKEEDETNLISRMGIRKNLENKQKESDPDHYVYSPKISSTLKDLGETSKKPIEENEVIKRLREKLKNEEK